MSGIKMSNCKFYVNEEERTVVCVIPEEGDAVRDMLSDFIYDNFHFKDFNVWFALNLNMFIMPKSFSGKAVCSKEDEWNEELGKLIAFSRAKDKCYKSFFKRANLLIQTMDRRLNDMIEVFNNFGTKLETKREMLENQIEEKLNKKEGDA